MIPYGMNPFGLEDRKITFHVVQGSSEISHSIDNLLQTPINNRLYCWAQIPKALRDNYGIEWAAQDTWDSTHLPSWESFNSAPKYVSKKMENVPINSYVTYYATGDAGNTTAFFANYDVTNKTNAEIINKIKERYTYSDGTTITIINKQTSSEPYWADPEKNSYTQYMVSGNSSNPRHFYQVLPEIEDQYPEYATVFIIDTSGSMGNADYNKVKQAIYNVIVQYNEFEHNPLHPKEDSYIWIYYGTYLNNIEQCGATLNPDDYSNLEVLKDNIIKMVNGLKKRSSSEAMITCLYYTIADIQSKILMRDGSPRVADKLRGITFVLLTDETLWKSDTLNGESGLESFSWYKTWKESTNTDAHFPLRWSDNSVASKRDFANAINKTLKNMSYFYGVNMRWAVANGLSNSTDISDRLKDNSKYIIPIIEASSYDQEWIANSYNEDIDAPFAPMIRITFKVPSGMSISAFEGNLMAYATQFQSSTTIKSKYWKGVLYTASGYDTYTIFRYNKETTTLPNVTGYQWKHNNGTVHAGGSGYTLNDNEFKDIIFTLERAFVTKNFTVKLRPERRFLIGESGGFCGRYLELYDDLGNKVIDFVDKYDTSISRWKTVGAGNTINANLIPLEYTLTGSTCKIKIDKPLSVAARRDNGSGSTIQSLPVGPNVLDNGILEITNHDALVYYYSFTDTYPSDGTDQSQNRFKIYIENGYIKTNSETVTEYTITLNDANDQGDQVVNLCIQY